MTGIERLNGLVVSFGGEPRTIRAITRGRVVSDPRLHPASSTILEVDLLLVGDPEVAYKLHVFDGFLMDIYIEKLISRLNTIFMGSPPNTKPLRIVTLEQLHG